MNAKVIFIVILILGFVYKIVRSYIIDNHRKKPLPDEVSDIYDEKRYQDYLNYNSEYRKLSLVSSFISLVIDFVLIFGGFFTWVENLIGNNVYYISLFTVLCMSFISLISEYIIDYISTFKIEEKYGLNKKDIKEFNRSFFLDNIFELIVMMIMVVIIIFICENMKIWTNNYSIDFSKALIIATVIVVIALVFMLFASVLSLILLRLQYTFTPLEDGELKDRINELQSSSKKKVKTINVYNESKKSTTKNAFLLKFLWIKEFGIADNFINDNSFDELLAVLSHEIGHLKHKKNILNYMSYMMMFILFMLFVLMTSHMNIIIEITQWVNASFHLNHNNYYLLLIFYIPLLKPLLSLSGIFNNYRVREEEYEADREAVNNGYGDELVDMFKRLSKDELVNVYPSPIIEFLEYDHPGMYNRIKAIREYQKKIQR